MRDAACVLGGDLGDESSGHLEQNTEYTVARSETKKKKEGKKSRLWGGKKRAKFESFFSCQGGAKSGR
jgi:hypothetical protein